MADNMAESITKSKGNLVSRVSESRVSERRAPALQSMHMRPPRFEQLEERRMLSTIDVYPGDNVQAKLNPALPGDTVTFKKLGENGLFEQGIGEVYDFKSGVAGNKIAYTSEEGVELRGFGGDAIISISGGGYVDISNLTLSKDTKGIIIGIVPFEDITISGVNFNNILDYGIVYENRPNYSNQPNGERADITVQSCTMNGGKQLIHQIPLDYDMDQYSPFAAAYNNDVYNLTVFMMDAPKADIPGHSEINLGSTIKIGEDYVSGISGNFLVNSKALSDPRYYAGYSSPADNVYVCTKGGEVVIPYLTEQVSQGVKDSEGNLFTFPGDADMNGKVDYQDLGIVATDYDLTGITGRTWTQGDFNYDRTVDYQDLGTLATNYGSGEAGSLINSPAVKPATNNLAYAGNNAIGVYPNKQRVNILEKATGGVAPIYAKKTSSIDYKPLQRQQNNTSQETDMLSTPRTIRKDTASRSHKSASLEENVLASPIVQII